MKWSILPEHIPVQNARCILFTKRKSMHIGYWDNIGFTWHSNAGTTFDTAYITHWQYAPKEPEVRVQNETNKT